MQDTDSLPAAVVKALLISVVAVLPVFLMLYTEQPQVRWAVDEWIGRQAYRVRLLEWRRRWEQLPGWRQEQWNHAELPPLELRQVEPDWSRTLGRT